MVLSILDPRSVLIWFFLSVLFCYSFNRCSNRFTFFSKKKVPLLLIYSVHRNYFGMKWNWMEWCERQEQYKQLLKFTITSHHITAHQTNGIPKLALKLISEHLRDGMVCKLLLYLGNFFSHSFHLNVKLAAMSSPSKC